MTNSLIAYYESVAGKYGCGKANALHLGCGPGYTSLMLSKTFDLVRKILTYAISFSALRWLGLTIVDDLLILPCKFKTMVW